MLEDALLDVSHRDEIVIDPFVGSGSYRLSTPDVSGALEAHADFVLKLPLIAEVKEKKFVRMGQVLMARTAGEPLNPARMSIEQIEKLKALLARHVFEAQYQQRPRASSSGYCELARLARYSTPPKFEAFLHSWDIAATKGGGDWTICCKFGLARGADGRDRLYLIGIVRIQVELPEVREAIIGHDRIDRPSLIILDGKGVGRGIHKDLWGRGFRHLLAGQTINTSATDNLKVRRFNEALFYLYDGFVLLPESMVLIQPQIDPVFRLALTHGVQRKAL